MEPDNLRELIHACPVRLTMNNGDVFDVEKPEFIRIAEFDVAVLVNRNGRKRNVLIALDNISSAESLSRSAS